MGQEICKLELKDQNICEFPKCVTKFTGLKSNSTNNLGIARLKQRWFLSKIENFQF